jgi:putative membrane protein
MKILLRIVILALVIMALPYVIPGIEVGGFYPALVAAIMLSVLNLVIKPVISLLTLPVNVITLGLFGLVVNGVLLWFVASFVDGLSTASFLPAFLGALIISATNWLVSKF